MATTTIKTRIRNKVDTYKNWSEKNPVLLDGEIVIVRVPTGDTYTNPVTGKDEPVVELMMKVGNNETAFNSLPWLSGKASDVYNWAKNPAVEDVTVKVVTGGTEANPEVTNQALSNWLKTFYSNDQTHTVNIAANKVALDTLKGADTVTGSVAYMIKTAIEALDVTGSDGEGTFVKAVTQTDGKIKVTKGTISEDEVPKLSASKIIVTAGVGDAEETLAEKLISIDASIAGINTAIAGGVHYVGVVTAPADLSSALTTQTVTLKDITGNYTANAGDVVIQGEKEFIWTGSKWQELGDLSRVGALETWKAGLAYSDSEVTSKFVTSVTQNDGKITVTRAQPTSADISHSDTTVSAELANHEAKIASIETDYVRFNSTNNQLYVGKEGTDYIIFDCGNATIA